MISRIIKRIIMGLVLILSTGCVGKNSVIPSETPANVLPTNVPFQPTQTTFPAAQEPTSIPPTPTIAVPVIQSSQQAFSFSNSGQEMAAAHSWDVALGDLDNDGDLDALIANDNQNGHKILLNDSQGLFTMDDQKLEPCLRAALGDIDEDGDLDAVVTTWDHTKENWLGPASVWSNDGWGQFTKNQENLGGSEVFNLALGDLNNDGMADIFFAAVGENTVWLNDGNGSFYDSKQRLTTGIDAAIALGDLDNDGDLDALTGGWEGPAKVWVNNGLGVFSVSGQTITGNNLHIHDLALVDLDQDGDLDAVLATAGGGSHEVLQNDGSGFFSPWQQLTGPLTHGTAWGDIDRDGDSDVVFAHGTRGGGYASIWLNDGQGLLKPSPINLGDRFSSAAALGDLNQDGSLDIFVTHTRWGHSGDGESNQVWFNTDSPQKIVVQPPENAILGDEWLRPTDSLPMVYVPGGTFWMGSEENDPLASVDELPQHTVTLNNFWIDRTEVPNTAYNLCIDAEVCRPSRYTSNPAYNGDAMPAVGISWQDAVNYCNWVGGRLPFEAEWEYAAKGETGSRYPWGNEFDGKRVNFCDTNCGETWADPSVDDGFEESAPVGSYPTGASWTGALDMAGNVWEWVWDWYSSYTVRDQNNPTGPEPVSGKIIRGGCWANGEDGVRTTYRIDSGGEINPSTRHPNIGFRCVLGSGNSDSREINMEKAPTTAPLGNPVNIDGTLTSREWENARIETFTDGSDLLMMHYEGYLYLGIRSNTPGMIVGNIYLHQDDEISILHSSAALGTAIYKKGGETWQQIQPFSWCCRNTSSSPAADAEHAGFLERDGWLAANARMGAPDELEYKIKMEDEYLRLVVTFLRAAVPNENIPWPTRITDDSIRPMPGGYPSEMVFDPGSWAVITLSTEPE